MSEKHDKPFNIEELEIITAIARTGPLYRIDSAETLLCRVASKNIDSKIVKDCSCNGHTLLHFGCKCGYAKIGIS